MSRSFADQAGEIEGQGEGVGDEHGLGSVRQAKPGRALDAALHLNGISALGVGLATDAQLPGLRADLEIAGQANTAIGEAEAKGQGVAQRVMGFGKLAGLPGSDS